MNKLLLLTQMPDSYNNLGKSNIKFKWTQNIRLTMILCTAALVLLMMFILARVSFFYINVWALVSYFFALIFIGHSAGRTVTEGKLKERASKNLNASSRFTSSKTPSVDLQPWTAWRRSIRLYAISVSFIFILPFLFYFTRLQHDVLCQLVYEGYEADKTACSNTTLPTLVDGPAEELYNICILDITMTSETR